MAEFLHCSPETVTTWLISYTSIQKEKLKKKKDSRLTDLGLGFEERLGEELDGEVRTDETWAFLLL